MTAGPDGGILKSGALRRPGLALDCLPDLSPSGHDLIQANLAGIALGERIGRDQASLAPRIEQGVRAEQEVGDQVGAAAHAMADSFDQVLAVGGAE